jgi:hypothetical protein
MATVSLGTTIITLEQYFGSASTWYGSRYGFLSECGPRSSFENECGSGFRHYVKTHKNLPVTYNGHEVTCTHFLRHCSLLFTLVMPNYLCIDCVLTAFFPSFSLLFKSPGPGSAFRMRIRIQAAIECGSKIRYLIGMNAFC